MMGSRILITIAIVFMEIAIFLPESMSNDAENNMKMYSKFVHERKVTSDCSDWHIAMFLREILIQYMPATKMLSILLKSETRSHCDNDVLNEFIKYNTYRAITIATGARCFDSPAGIGQKPSGYLILNSDLPSVLKSLTRVGKSGSDWNPRGLYIAIARSKIEMIDIMKILSSNNIFKTVILLLPRNYSETAEVYAWRPFYAENHCETPAPENIIRLGTFTKNFQFQRESDIHLETIPAKFNNCPFNISLNIWPPFIMMAKNHGSVSFYGMELNLIRIICEQLRLDLRGRFHPLGSPQSWEVAEAGSCVPSLKHLTNREISYPYIQDSFIWTFPRDVDITGWKNFVAGFSWQLWTLSIATSCIMVVSLMVNKFKGAALWTWGSFWEQSCRTVPYRIRGIMSFWLLLCLHLSATYKTKLISFLTNPVTENTIRCQKDLVNSDLELNFMTAAETFFDDSDEIDRLILKKYVPCSDIERCYLNIPEGRAVFTNELFSSYLAVRSHTIDRTSTLPTSLTYNIATIFRKGHPVLIPFNKMLLLVKEFGFLEHWRRETATLVQRSYDEHKINRATHKDLSMSHLRGVFYLFNLFSMIAIFAFICEIIYHHFLSDKCRKWQCGRIFNCAKEGKLSN